MNEKRETSVLIKGNRNKNNISSFAWLSQCIIAYYYYFMLDDGWSYHLGIQNINMYVWALGTIMALKTVVISL